MKNREKNLLLTALLAPEGARRWCEADWGLAIRQARSANMLAALAERLHEVEPALPLPDVVQPILATARRLIEHRNETVLWECRQIAKALAPIGVQPILLKGAAYVAEGIPLARHRHFSDIDVMVPRLRLGEAETQLMLAGWLPTTRDAYDQRYYRQWMHEVPPLRHIHRGTSLDLHHALTPLTARYQANMQAVFAAVRPSIRLEEALVLEPADQILHACVHLFAEGEADFALRNLYDIAELLCYHRAQEKGFIDRLVARSEAIGLAQPLFLAAHFLGRVLAFDSREMEQALASARPSAVVLRALEAVYEPLFQGIHPSVRRSGFGLARQMLYLRGHWLRMPLYLLVPHLIRKALRTLGAKREAAEI